MIVSYVIPVYNMEKYVGLAIRSVLAQYCNDDLKIELVIVNDGSIDSSLNVIHNIVDKITKDRFIVNIINFEHNKGAGTAVYEGFKAATGDYICFLSSDDCIINPLKTYDQIMHMIHTNSDLSYCSKYMTGTDFTSSVKIKASFIYTYDILNKLILHNNYLTYFFLNFKNPINSSTIMIKRSALETYGLWDPLLKSDCDGELLLRYSLNGAKITEFTNNYIGVDDIFYRLHPNQLSNDNTVMNEYIMANRNKYKKIVLEGNYPIWLKLLVKLFVKV